MSLSDFIRTYYIDPVVLNQGYNYVNSITYALLAVFLAYLTYKLLEKTKVTIDKNFVASVISLATFGAFIRLFEEAGIFASYFLVSPMIWVEAFIFILSLFVASKFIERKFSIPYHKILIWSAIALSIAPLLMILSRIVNLTGMLITVSLLVPFAIVFYFIKWGRGNKLVTMSHTFDAVASFTATQFFGFTELYPIPRILTGVLNPVSFVAVKIIVVVAILVLIDRYSKDKNYNNFLKLVIAVLGLGPAIRNFFLLGLS